MPTIDATIGGVDANSYVDESAADSYFDARSNSSAWFNVADSDDKARALITATDRIDQERFIGTQATEEQRLKWPRIGATRDDGIEIPSDELPRELESATMELALEILRGGTSDIFAPTGLEAFKSIKAGSTALEMRDPPQPLDSSDPAATSAAAQRSNLPPQVQRLLRDFIISDISIYADIPTTTRLTRT